MQKWEVFTWIVRIRTAISSSGKEGRCDMTELEKMNESLKKAGESLSRVSMQARIACLENELAYERKKN